MRTVAINTTYKSAGRVALAVAFILLLPLLAMQFTDEVVWDLTDFAVAGALLLGAGFTYELVARKAGNIAYRAAVGVAVTAALMLVWMNLAVGLIGSDSVFKKFVVRKAGGLTSGHGTPEILPNRPQRQRMGLDSTSGARGKTRGPTGEVPQTGNPERHLLYRARRWCVAALTP